MFVFVVSPVIEVRGRGCLQQRLQHSRCSGSYLNKGNGQVKYLSKSGQYYRYHWSSRDNDFGRTIDGRTAEFGAHGCFRSVSLGNASPTVLLEEASCDKASLTSCQCWSFNHSPIISFFCITQITLFIFHYISNFRLIIEFSTRAMQT